MISRHLPCLLAATLAITTACAGDDGAANTGGGSGGINGGSGSGGCFAGAQGCMCFDGSCQVGLSCVQNVCVTGQGQNNTGGDGDGSQAGGDGDGDGDGSQAGGDGDGDGGGDGDGDGDGDGALAQGETGRMVGMTAAHNAVRATVGVPPLSWSPEIAAVAQAYADQMAQSCTFQHSGNPKYGENLAASGSPGTPNSTAQSAVDGWAAEVACWTYGTISGTEVCNMQCTSNMNSNGCGHYTQVVWEDTTEVGCGVSTCNSGGLNWDYWVCNYAPPGNYIGQAPY